MPATPATQNVISGNVQGVPTSYRHIDPRPLIGTLVPQSLANIRNTRVASETVLVVLTGGL